ncbi:hypothetical protein H6761_01235 [Candidatus Nomurabacteria bacterium]|nr:hypothetical protein [Candidatus Nomurabacteria bacterium]
MDFQEEKSVEIKTEKNHFKLTLSLLVILLIISNLLTVYFLFNKKNSEINLENQQNINIINQNIINGTNSSEEEEELATNEIRVDWKNWLAKISNANEIFGEKTSNLNESLLNNQNFIDNYGSLYEFVYNRVSFYNAGTIAEGPYQGKDLYLATLPCEGPCLSNGISRIINNDGELIIIKNESSLNDENSLVYFSYGSLFKFNNLITIKNLEDNPEIVNIPNTNNKFTKAETDPKKILSDYNAQEILSNDEVTIYKDNVNNCYIAEQNDHSAINYILDLNFVGEESQDPSSYFGLKPYKLNISFDDNSDNNNEYLFNKTFYFSPDVGCYDYANFISNNSQIKKTGETFAGDAIYELADINLKEQANDQKSLLQSMYDTIYSPEGQDKPSFSEFLADHPVLFWQDPFGKYIMFKNAKYVPPVEMGKPVIYLYPEKTTDILVKVFPNNGLTITEPEYKNGWLVKADPEGNLYNYDDQKNYPYLFWEGLGLNYQMPDKGFVVARENIIEFLTEKLAQQGLIAQEYNEFIDFWAPKMQEKPYYFITFVPQEQFDQLAPLEVSPKPDTIIRVFMDYRALDQKINVQAQTFKTPIREGFVLTEWGGALH